MKNGLLIKFFLVFVGYFVSARLGLSMPYVGSHVTLIWLPTGVAVAALMRWGTSMTPAVLLGAFCVNMTISPDVLLSFSIAIGNTLAPLAACFFLVRAGFDLELKRRQDIFLLITAAFSSMLISATCGSLALAFSGVISADSFADAWLSWWLGDSIGVLLAAPVLLVASKKCMFELMGKRNEIAIWFMVLAVFSCLTFIVYTHKDGDLLPFVFFLIPLIIWASLRFDQLTASFGVIVLALISSFGTSLGHGAFMLPSHHVGLMTLWAFLTTTIVINLLTSALLSESRAAKEALNELNIELENRVAQELSANREKEKLLIQQSKMAVMGEMIGAIAHQWRQPLNSLGMTIQDVELAYKFGELDEQYLASYKKEAMGIIQSMSTTIDDFKNFFSANKKQEEFYIEDAIKDVLKILSAQFRLNSTEIIFDVDNGSKHKYLCYKNELKQVLLNILANAKDALIEKKKENSFVKIEVSQNENGYEVAIEDSAGGIDEAIMDKIFEPYFTTKPSDKGTGIGLYLSREIIEDHLQGKLTVENTQHGAKFTIWLPNIATP
jgi:signal transduction histidine kinase